MGRKSNISILVVGRVQGYLSANNLTLREIANQCGVSIGTRSNIKSRTTAGTIEPRRKGRFGRKQVSNERRKSPHM